ncbi:hypothetical protein KSX_55740 [Ktedonospora formicarum]|uniref:Uncharacterized protein n=1 Tax=Ktedonospora formicarum TaxID=2778364 RepID=A0A8J3MUY8_9CHLR|nr:hypothetical protein KSX_55740 [Ktedonospora formicarum]
MYQDEDPLWSSPKKPCGDIVNAREIVEFIVRNSGEKWTPAQNLLGRKPSERPQMKVQW